MRDGYAFPFQGVGQSEAQLGMTLREWYAGQALQGLLAQPSEGLWSAKDLAGVCGEYADAMMRERKETEL